MRLRLNEVRKIIRKQLIHLILEADDDEEKSPGEMAEEEEEDDEEEEEDDEDEDDEDEDDDEDEESGITGDKAKVEVDKAWSEGRTFISQAAQGSTGEFEVEVMIAGGKIRPGIRIIKFEVEGENAEDFNKRLTDPKFYAQFNFNKDIGSASEPYAAMLSSVL